ncbi:hypothetical protein RVR_10541 [Actinacidiphila reveromycinica]|uniref:Uncharacterized protein n=1 Tax=Actinacidiphila reveromycinica TaxID=659352 RepID=A0A7U3UZ48_9ACTN|nr:hypothetical protein RVR_10541 [Streptomyces sp. SN-593]
MAPATSANCSSGMKCPASGTTTPVAMSAHGLMEAAMPGMETWRLEPPRMDTIRCPR